LIKSPGGRRIETARRPHFLIGTRALYLTPARLAGRVATTPWAISGKRSNRPGRVPLHRLIYILDIAETFDFFEKDSEGRVTPILKRRHAEFPRAQLSTHARICRRPGDTLISPPQPHACRVLTKAHTSYSYRTASKNLDHSRVRPYGIIHAAPACSAQSKSHFLMQSPIVGVVPHLAPSGAPPFGQNTDANVSFASQFTAPSPCTRRRFAVPGSPLAPCGP